MSKLFKMLLFLCLFITKTALALSCEIVPLETNYESAREVLYVKTLSCLVPETRLTESHPFRCPVFKWNAKVLEVLKGDQGILGSEIVFSGGDKNFWPRHFDAQTEYLLFLGKDQTTASTGGCGSTQSFVNSDDGDQQEISDFRHTASISRTLHALRNLRDGTTILWPDEWAVLSTPDGCRLEGGGLIFSYARKKKDPLNSTINETYIKLPEERNPSLSYEHTSTIGHINRKHLPSKVEVRMLGEKYPFHLTIKRLQLNLGEDREIPPVDVKNMTRGHNGSLELLKALIVNRGEFAIYSDKPGNPVKRATSVKLEGAYNRYMECAKRVQTGDDSDN